jgi:glycosyltransferase involved in cell wall biosynthesis
MTILTHSEAGQVMPATIRSLTALPGLRGLPSGPRPDVSHQPDRVLGNGNGHSAQRGTQRSYRQVSDGLAIAPTVSVVIPAMNEAANLPAVFATLPGWIDQVVLVDGHSTDDTIAVARALRPDVTVVLQGGIGKGDALVAGFAACTTDIIVAMDADGSTDGREIIRFVSALVSGADFVKGSRFASAGRSDDITAIRRCGNRGLNLLVNSLFGTQYTDLCYGYNAFWARHLPKLALDSPGFEVEALMGIRAAKARLRIHEVASHERPREYGTSNLHAVRDGCRIFKLIVRERFAGRRHRAAKPFLAAARTMTREAARP